MASSAGQKPLILTAAEADLQRAGALAAANARIAERQADAPRRGPGSAIAYAVAVLILLVAGYLWFSSIWNTMTLIPTVTETIPSPDINSSVTPAPATPPAPQATAPPADAPATNP